MARGTYALHERLRRRDQSLDGLATVDRAAIEDAATRIAPSVRHTPLLAVNASDFGLPAADLRFKLELLQHSGSFKARGAFNALRSQAIPAAGVVAASGGNHGAAVAFAARALGVPAKIFVPTISSEAKLARLRAYGADLVVTGERYADALAASERWAADAGALRVHAYDQFETVAGQGTVAREIEADAAELDTVLVAVGGGGLIGGIAAWYGGRARVIGVEPFGAPTLATALEAGEPVDVQVGGLAADSLGARRIGALMFPIAQRFVERVVLVDDEHIVAAQRALWDVLRVATEPGGAAAFAALLSSRYVPAPGERVGIVLCGGNSSAVSFGE